MKHPLTAPAACLLSAVLLAGCQSPGAKLPVNTTKYAHENTANFVLMDSGAQRSITSSGIQEGRTQDGRLEVAVNVRNRQNRRLQVQINCEFKDPQGFAVESTSWQTLFLTENGQETVRFTAISDKASKYTVRVREAR